MTLSLYIARKFLRAFLLVLLGFWGILILIDTIEQLRGFPEGTISLLQAAGLAALNVPASLYAILPLIVVLASVVLFLGLSRSSELVVIRAAGRSALRMLVAPVVVAALLGAAMVAIGNPIITALTNRYEQLSATLSGTGRETISIGREGVWMRQSAQWTDSSGTVHPGQAVIHSERGNSDGTELFDVTFMIFDRAANPVRRIEADRALLTPGAWQMFNAKDWSLASSTNPERDSSRTVMLNLPSSLTADSIRESFGNPNEIAIWDLPKFIRGLKDAGFSTRRHLVWFQMELALPLIFVSMVLLTAGFTMRHTRFGRTGMMVLLALASGLAVFFLRNVTQVLGDNGQLPVSLAAWTPPAVALLLALALLLHLEEG
ncbi:LPS export ABC transporter permease LptG [Thioclava sp. SK-1]|uniref:LPS export ABC transporter permease LptG n=1 Tax=Thioclava sp. SK-1 TaxID=1889770 RepID=UPI0008260BF4|nr:LPS export ABC transporter permease LptG [Thioclava sp. SK-1]OCX66134.1 LPS export ABC transporter permease LptG [Thioclava sp. SK-1]